MSPEKKADISGARTDLLHGASWPVGPQEDWLSWCLELASWKRSMALDTGIASLFSCPDEQPSWQRSVLQSRLLSFCGKLLFIICSSLKVIFRSLAPVGCHHHRCELLHMHITSHLHIIYGIMEKIPYQTQIRCFCLLPSFFIFKFLIEV